MSARVRACLRAGLLVVAAACIREEGFIRRAKHRVTAALRDRNYMAMHRVSQKAV
jgi:hypothetical protein